MIIEPGTRCRYRYRNDVIAMALGDLVVTVVRPHPRLDALCEVEARDGYRTWIAYRDLYPLKGVNNAN